MPFEPMARAREEELAGTRRLFGVRPLLTVLDGAPSRGLSFSRWNWDTRRFFFFFVKQRLSLQHCLRG